MDNRTMKSIQKLSKSLKNVIVLKWREQKGMDRDLIIRALEFITNDISNDYILELKNVFPEDRTNFSYINKILNELQDLQEKNQQAATEVNNWIKASAKGAYDEIQNEIQNGNQNGIYVTMIIGTAVVALLAVYLVNRRRR